jgi:hypothetical protein
MNGEIQCDTPAYGILFGIKRNELLIHATTWVKIENIVLRKRNPTEMSDIIYFHLG